MHGNEIMKQYNAGVCGRVMGNYDSNWSGLRCWNAMHCNACIAMHCNALHALQCIACIAMHCNACNACIAMHAMHAMHAIHAMHNVSKSKSTLGKR